MNLPEWTPTIAFLFGMSSLIIVVFVNRHLHNTIQKLREENRELHARLVRAEYSIDAANNGLRRARELAHELDTAELARIGALRPTAPTSMHVPSITIANPEEYAQRVDLVYPDGTRKTVCPDHPEEKKSVEKKPKIRLIRFRK